eukprot:556750-Amphidinium_carterae.1
MALSQQSGVTRDERACLDFNLRAVCSSSLCAMMLLLLRGTRVFCSAPAFVCPLAKLGTR